MKHVPAAFHDLITPTDHDVELFVEAEISESSLAMLMTDASIDQILGLDVSLKITAWNRACEKATGIARENAIGKLFTSLIPGVVEYPHVMSALVKALKGLKSFVPSDKGAYNGGYSEHHFIPLKSPSGVIGVLVVIHNVAHRVKAEQELQRLNAALAKRTRDLEEKSEELTQFNWIASHDLKEPLRKIYTFLEMIATKEGGKLSDAGRSNLRRAQSAAQRLGLLTDDIATFTQVAAPTEELMDIGLNSVLEASLVKHQRSINNLNIQVEFPTMPAITGYPEMLKLLFCHMIGNAIKFRSETEQPQILISYSHVKGQELTHRSADESQNYHCISFQDNGIGFALEYAEKIFIMFQRLNDDRVYRGTGMGLAICKKAVAAHRGFISVESEEGSGSTFHCYLADGLQRPV